MNRTHLDYLASDLWKERLEADLVPWIEQVADLGDDVLEIGPGPGLTTDILRTRSAHVTAVELDTDLAAALTERLADRRTRDGLSGRGPTLRASSRP